MSEADLSGPPLYGNLLCRLAVQPYSVLRPLAEALAWASDSFFIKKSFQLLGVFLGRLPWAWNFSPHPAILYHAYSECIRVIASAALTPSAGQLHSADGSDIPAIWGEFAYRPTKLTFEKPADPVKETLSRAVGNRLYD
ncbi:hypothetical protein TELCIR_12870, partial [Teladorsagia circumcincta]